MFSDRVTLRQLSRHIHNPPRPLKLRQSLRLGNVALRVMVTRVPFSIMTQNMALLVRPAPYLGTNRKGAINELIAQIRALSPDIVGLCEVFAEGERWRIQRGVADLYHFSQHGPDENDSDSDGGLLLLSKHPMVERRKIVYEDYAGGDGFANKGVIYARVHPPNSPTPYNIFFSHTQNIEEGGGKEALYAQLTQMNEMIQSHANPKIPTFIIGDLNIPGEVPEHYNQLLGRLGQPVDLWTVAGNPPDSGFTNTSDNNFYELRADAPTQSHRLDYVLMKAGLMFIPILSHINILRWTHGERFISDHFGLYAEFKQLVQVVP